MKQKQFKLTMNNRRAIADLLVLGELPLEDNGKYKGSTEHSTETIDLLIKHGYAERKANISPRGNKLVRPTIKAVYLIPVNA